MHTQHPDSSPGITVDVISDVVCPWCYIGKRRLERAVAMTPDLDIDIRWRPYQLDPTIPPEGRVRNDYLVAKFGSIERVEEIFGQIREVGRTEGIDFDFSKIERSPNTFDAHRVIRWAGVTGLQGEVKQRLLTAYFEEGTNVGDRAELVRLAGEAGMDAALVETLLAGEADAAETRDEIDMAARMGIRGVPTFLVESRYALVGAQDADKLADAFVQVAAAKARGELPPLE